MLLLLSPGIFAQDPLPILSNNGRYGVNLGMTAGIGTHRNRLGFFIEAVAVPVNRVQFGASLRTQHMAKNLGPKGEHSEINMSLGVLLGFGPNRDQVAPFFNYLQNQTGANAFLAYSFNMYFNEIETSQQTGTLGLGVGDFFVYTENDALADGIKDRFRTASLMLGWEFADTRVALNTLMWTGDPSSKGRTNVDKALYPSKHGAVHLGKAKYGNLSHGVLAAQVQHRLGWGQILRLEAGIDAEQIRHAIQNRLIHDAIIIPEFLFEIKNRHVPMVTKTGEPYLYREGQEIRKPKLYLQGDWNPGIFW